MSLQQHLIRFRQVVALSLIGFLLSLPLGIQATESLPLKLTQITDSIYMIQGRGGNIGVSVGADGIFLVDDQYAPATPEILEQLQQLHPGKIGYVINTHWHGDHTGGNENLAQHGATIVAHDNVRERMSTEQLIALFRRKIPASPATALPVITFQENINFHLNNDDVHIVHMPNAHTDGDAIVHFKNANVIHLGDIYFNGIFPFIDTSSGGNVAGVIKAIDYTLTLANEQTRIIPGHGQLSNISELKIYRDMLLESTKKVEQLIKDGKSLEEIQAAKPLAKLEQTWGKGFIKTDTFVAIIFNSLHL